MKALSDHKSLHAFARTRATYQIILTEAKLTIRHTEFTSRIDLIELDVEQLDDLSLIMERYLAIRSSRKPPFWSLSSRMDHSTDSDEEPVMSAQELNTSNAIYRQYTNILEARHQLLNEDKSAGIDVRQAIVDTTKSLPNLRSSLSMVSSGFFERYEQLYQSIVR